MVTPIPEGGYKIGDIKWTPRGEEAVTELYKLFKGMRGLVQPCGIFDPEDFNTLQLIANLGYSAVHKKPYPGTEPPEPPIEFDLD